MSKSTEPTVRSKSRIKFFVQRFGGEGPPSATVVTACDRFSAVFKAAQALFGKNVVCGLVISDLAPTHAVYVPMFEWTENAAEALADFESDNSCALDVREFHEDQQIEIRG